MKTSSKNTRNGNNSRLAGIQKPVPLVPTAVVSERLHNIAAAFDVAVSVAVIGFESTGNFMDYLEAVQQATDTARNSYVSILE